MATFRKRGNKWSFRIDIGRDPITNERKQLTVSKSKEYPNGFDNKTVKLAAATMQHELSMGTYVKEENMLFTKFSVEWLKSYKSNKKISSYFFRANQVKVLNKYFELDMLKNITKKRYQAFLDYLLSKYAHNTIIGFHSVGKMMFDYAVEYEYIKVNPTTYAKISRKQKTVEELENENEVPKYLEKKELALFLKTAKEQGLDNDYFCFLLLAYSGMRVGEICALKKTDFDKIEHKVSITKTLFNPAATAKEYELITPKTKSSRRKIDLDPMLFDELDKLVSRQNEVKMLYRKTYHDKDFILANLDEYPGYPSTLQKVERRMARILRIAKLNTNLTPHSLRHTHTSLCAEAGVPLEEIMDRLGHNGDKTTRAVYLHVTKTRKKDASYKFSELMKNTNILEQ